MRIRTFLKPLSFIPALLLMYMIYSFSAQEGTVSSDLSYKASYTLVEAADELFNIGLEPWEIDSWANRLNGPTRKLAHMTEYFALAVAVSFPLYVYGLHGILLVLLAGGICVAFACGDEYHQSFVAGRSPQQRDVMIDSIGILIGIILVRIVGWTGRKTVFRPDPDHPTKKELRRIEKERIAMQREREALERDRQRESSNRILDRNLASGPSDNRYTRSAHPDRFADPYMQEEYREEETSSDELSEDMPLSHLFKPKD